MIMDLKSIAYGQENVSSSEPCFQYNKQKAGREGREGEGGRGAGKEEDQ